MVKLSTLKVKIVQRGVDPVTLSEIKNAERVHSLDSRIVKTE